MKDEMEEEFMRIAQEAAQDQTVEAVRGELEKLYPGLSQEAYEDYLGRIETKGNPAVYLGFYLDDEGSDPGRLICAMTTPEVMPDGNQVKFSSQVYSGEAATVFIAEQEARFEAGK